MWLQSSPLFVAKTHCPLSSMMCHAGSKKKFFCVFRLDLKSVFELFEKFFHLYTQVGSLFRWTWRSPVLVEQKGPLNHH